MTPEEMLYELSPYYQTVGEEAEAVLLGLVASRLPADVQEHFEDVGWPIVVILSETDGVVRSFGGEMRDFIFLNMRGRRSRKRKMTTIAHEIAHVYLGHSDTRTEANGATCESAADDLCESWGFGRAYANYQAFQDG